MAIIQARFNPEIKPIIYDYCPHELTDLQRQANEFMRGMTLLAGLTSKDIDVLRSEFKGWVETIPLSSLLGLSLCIRLARMDRKMPWEEAGE